MKYDIPAALQKLTPGAEWVLRGSEYSGLEWIDGHGQDKPTEAAITAKIAELDGAEAIALLTLNPAVTYPCESLSISPPNITLIEI